MQSVLVYVHHDAGQTARLQAALDLVRAFEGHLTCLQATPFDTYLTGDPFGSVYALPQILSEIRRDEKEEREAIDRQLGNEGVNWDWLTYNGSAAAMLIDHSLLSDVVVVSPLPKLDGGASVLPPPIAADVAVHSPAPILVVPNDARGFDCFGPMLIAWNGSKEACQALRSAMPLLRMAEGVTILTVGGEGEADIPATEAATFLSRHGVFPDIAQLPESRAGVADTIRQAAIDGEAGCIVMGAYGHSRLRERVLGGVTREMLEDSPAPLLLAH